MVRIATACLVLAATLAVFAGCGNSKPASAGPPGARVLTAQAEAINLRTGDVPGMSVTSYGSDVAPNAIGVQLRRCAGALPDWEAGSLRSAKFAPQSLSHLVWSAIRVVPSPTVAVRDFAGNRTAQFRNCVASVFAAAVAKSGSLVHERTSASHCQLLCAATGALG